MNIDDQIYDQVEGHIESQLVRQLWNQMDIRCINQGFENLRDMISNPIRNRVWSQLNINNEHR